MSAWNKGRRLPHSLEWEQKRIAAIRQWAKLKSWPRGYRRSREQVAPMLEGLKKAMAENPKKFRDLAITNLPKDCRGEKNGNWKGGITKLLRGARFTGEYKRWRTAVLNRDGHKCRLCGRTDKLQVHHVVSLAECPGIAYLPMNGVVLCSKCHYENDAVWKGERFKKAASFGDSDILIFVIPHKFQAYPTVGNWQYLPNGTLIIFVSQLSKRSRQHLVAYHEFHEAVLCKHAGISHEIVDQFDIEFERRRKPGDFSEPGDDPSAPYHDQHQRATTAERLLAYAMDENWNEYESEINGLSLK